MLTGRRLPLRWTGDVRKSSHTRGTFTLLDAAAFATGCLNLSDLSTVPDFTCLSFYKIFGFPHLGALIIIRKSPEVAELIRHRRYFGGGTLEVVTALEESPLHSKKTTNYHSALEDGTPTYLSIFAIGHAIKTFNQFFTNMSCVPQHTASLTKHLWEGMVGFHHTNGKPLVRTYNHNTATCGDAKTQGATIAFNVLYPDGSPPGVYKGKPLGSVRVSLGVMSMLEDVKAFLEFLSEEYLDKEPVKYDEADFFSPPATESGEDQSTVMIWSDGPSPLILSEKTSEPE
ncbi:pyridoxal phosphate-dependent transferase [Phyllosticta paracitricarpa]|uniref:Pyridoxal phosphate-dependent transferase n=1 Tax=Phyllosticta paracitricarpa TaxID=2016321 RepID=A0ABR1NEN0_9PEZI